LDCCSHEREVVVDATRRSNGKRPQCVDRYLDQELALVATRDRTQHTGFL